MIYTHANLPIQGARPDPPAEDDLPRAGLRDAGAAVQAVPDSRGHALGAVTGPAMNEKMKQN